MSNLANMLAGLSTGSRRLPLSQLIAECPRQLDQLLRDLVRMEGNWRVRFSSHDESGDMPFTLHIAKIIGAPGFTNMFMIEVSSTGVTWSTMINEKAMNAYMFKSIPEVIQKNLHENGVHNITELLVKHLCHQRRMASMTFDTDAHDAATYEKTHVHAYAQKTLTDRFDALIPHQHAYNKVKTGTRTRETTTSAGTRKHPSALERNKLQKQIRNIDALTSLMSETTIKRKSKK